MGDIINNLRTHTLGLQPLSLRSGPGLADRLRLPWTYCMSPTLVPKPKDWMNYIGEYNLCLCVLILFWGLLTTVWVDVVGFYFLDLATNYTPPNNLKAFLDAGPPPVYIG
jgi:sterol 3beta-glucosyltransferase